MYQNQLNCHFEVKLPLFPTHIQISKNKWIKVSGNSLWSGMNFFIRAKIKQQLSSYCKPFISSLEPLQGKIATGLDVYLPLNYGDVRWNKKLACATHKPITDKYEPRWDLKNFTFFWTKVLDDCLVEYGKIPDDNVSVLCEDLGSRLFIVDDLQERLLVYKIKILDVRCINNK